MLAGLCRGALTSSSFCMQRSAGAGSDAEFTYYGLDIEPVDQSGASHYVGGSLDLSGLPRNAPFAGGVFVYLPYEFDGKRPGSGTIFWLVTTLLTIDHRSNKAIMVHLASGNPDKDAERKRLADRLSAIGRLQVDGAPRTETIDDDWHADVSAADYSNSVGKIQDAIARAEISQAILSIGFSKSTSTTVTQVFEALRKKRPSPHVFMIKSDELSLVGASPAMHLLKRNDTIVIETDAGTRQIGKTAEETEALRNELLNSSKDREEQKMLVDETFTDLRAIAVDSRVSTPVELEVRQLGNVMHLFTVLEAKCPKNLGPIDAIVSCLPAAAVTGRPKKAAMAAIRSVERVKRGPYGGVVGLVGFDGSVDSAIILRSAWLKDGSISMRCGGGITHASVAVDEYNECLNKARAIMDSVREAEGA
ncbi:MAG: chorismate-binding protein [Hyphomicrobiales bacterium]|nr:chorismate-binding protein [Hyphomicrobiales bacterium]